MPPKNRRMSLRFVFRDGIRYLCRHPSAPSPLFPEKRKPASRPEVLRFADPIRNGLPSPAPSAGAYPPRPNPVVAPIPTSSTLFYYGKTRKTRHPLHGHAARPRSECRRYPQVAHRPRFPGRPRLAPGGLYLIHLDGSVERLVPNNEDRTVDPWEITNGARGYNATSRHIAYAGGVAADGTTPCDTRTPQQKSALEHYVRDFVARFPGAAVVGHNELAAKACPSFDVQAWLRETGIL